MPTGILATCNSPHEIAIEIKDRQSDLARFLQVKVDRRTRVERIGEVLRQAVVSGTVGDGDCYRTVELDVALVIHIRQFVVVVGVAFLDIGIDPRIVVLIRAVAGAGNHVFVDLRILAVR